MPLVSARRRAPVSCAAAIFLLILAAAHSAFAATFTVTPVRIYMKPQDRAEAAAPKDKIQVAIALALSMPVFITPTPAKRQVDCKVSRAQGETLDVACANKGSAYAQVREILVKRGDQVLGRFEGGAYILPGAHKILSIKTPGPLPDGRLQLVVTYDDGRSESFDVTVG